RAFYAELERDLVLRERPRRAAVNVAAELVEQQDQGEPSRRSAGPVVEAALRRLFHVGREVPLDLLVEHRVLAEPDLHAPVDLRRRELVLLEPEREHALDADVIFVGDRRIHAFAEELDWHGFRSDEGVRAL